VVQADSTTGCQPALLRYRAHVSSGTKDAGFRVLSIEFTVLSAAIGACAIHARAVRLPGAGSPALPAMVHLHHKAQVSRRCHHYPPAVTSIRVLQESSDSRLVLGVWPLPEQNPATAAALQVLPGRASLLNSSSASTCRRLRSCGSTVRLVAVCCT
jgi:hypothetical protein